MPELPEVEATRRHLEPILAGKRIMGVDVRRARMIRRQPHAPDFVARLVGRTVRRLGRHGKFMLTDLSGDIRWVTHLGMSGRLSVSQRGEPEVPHTNLVVRFGRGLELRFVDPRTFGFMAAFTPAEYATGAVARLGPDALDQLPPAAALTSALHRRTAPIKALLLDQNLIAGVGNIYADEALHRARIRPDRPGRSLRPEEVRRLRNAIGPVLREGLARGGTSLDDLAYLLPDGRAGDYVRSLRVYGREDEPCRRCGTPIRRTVIRQRSSFWCPECQS